VVVTQNTRGSSTSLRPGLVWAGFWRSAGCELEGRMQDKLNICRPSTNMVRMRVAFFGGTFDPIHRGHLRVACAAANAFALDRVLFAPVGSQPLKAKRPVASFADRMTMTMLAVTSAADPRFLVSGIDAPRTDGAPNYTVDTLAELSKEYPAATIFAIVGADSFLTLRAWRSSGQLLNLAQWIVVSRPEFPLTDDFLDLPEFAPLALTPEQRARIHLLANVHEEVSATELRRRLRAGDPCPGLLPASVSDYIQARHLYR
jgi:nicotinate-nucleotide adenylyltransferase